MHIYITLSHWEEDQVIQIRVEIGKIDIFNTADDQCFFKRMILPTS
jgi:hypothetical protein